MSVHDSATKGYTVGASTYASNRPSYPQEALDFISKQVVGEKTGYIVDLGAGTGIFTHLLATQQPRNRIVAVEPVSEMRAKIDSSLENVEIRAGTATEIPFKDGEVDVVVAAQAFHWFATTEALSEIARVLKPDGVLCLIWNGMDHSVDWISQYDDVADELWGDTPRHRTGAWKKAFTSTSIFEPLQHGQFKNFQEGDIDKMIGRVMSRSVVAKAPEETQKRIAKQVAELLTTHPDTKESSTYRLAYNTDVYFTRKLQ